MSVERDALNRLTSVSMLATSGGNDIVYQYDGFNTGCGGEPAFAQGRSTGTTKRFGASTRYCNDRFGQVKTKMPIVGVRTLSAEALANCFVRIAEKLEAFIEGVEPVPA